MISCIFLDRRIVESMGEGLGLRESSSKEAPQGFNVSFYKGSTRGP